MAVSMSKRDLGVLEKIKDPESNPAIGSLVDESLPRDPNVLDDAIYERVSRQERGIVLAMQDLESPLATAEVDASAELDEAYRKCVADLGSLIQETPEYASARNNRVQALRRLYGDHLLMADAPKSSQALLPNPQPEQRPEAAMMALNDLDTAITLLSPRSLFAALSPTASRTLSLAYTQRAAIYLATSKLVSSGSLHLRNGRREVGWTAIDFEEAASRDFAMGGRYGNEIAKGLAVSTNPTAKLCGQMVREMMKKEYEAAY